MTGTGRVAGGSVMVAKPLTYMNLSGDAVRLLVNAYLESTDELIVVYDDIDLPLGKLRIRPNGSAGTHNGMRSIVRSSATESFPRLRIGIGAAEQRTSARLRARRVRAEEQPIVDARHRARGRRAGAVRARRPAPRHERVQSRSRGSRRRREHAARTPPCYARRHDPSIHTLGELRASGYRVRSVKDEMRANLLAKIARGEPTFPGIHGYERTVIPAIHNAILSRHDIILLGLRGQAKTRILRSLTALLDERIPVIEGCEINDSPFEPTCKRCRRLAAEKGDDLPIAWMTRDERYREKLATPDVTVADLIGDIDPIKAANQRLTYADEEVIHYGIIPRTNRGIFAINELPDLAPRIQVALLNILEERDLQIRGFPVRIPMDVVLVFSANPEDYTSRGNIITPLKDRIDSQILTHYPQKIETARRITEQEAWLDRDGDDATIEIPAYIRDLIESIAFVARELGARRSVVRRLRAPDHRRDGAAAVESRAPRGADRRPLRVPAARPTSR